jgi:hypothetical protein
MFKCGPLTTGLASVEIADLRYFTFAHILQLHFMVGRRKC